MSAYKNQANKRPAPQKEAMSIKETGIKLNTAKPVAGSSVGKSVGSVTIVIR